MGLTDADLCRRAKEVEFQESMKHTFSSSHISPLDTLLLDVYNVLHPTRIDCEHREKLVREFDAMAKANFDNVDGHPVVEAFGSFVMDMFTAKSDLDLSLNFSTEKAALFERGKKISILKRFTKILYKQQRKGNVSGVLPILRARVPVLKVVHCGTGIECDISVENKDGISRSLIINLICLVDERFRTLSILVKAWAKAHNINSSKDRTLNSLTIILLVAFHLQTRNPPILPPFSALLKDGSHPVSVERSVHCFKSFGEANKESVAELFMSLLYKLSSVRSLWESGLCASAYEGSWISKLSKSPIINVEDFLDRTQNCASAVTKEELPKIYSCIDSSIGHLMQYMNGQTESLDLRCLLFGPLSHCPFNVDAHNGMNISMERKKKRKKKACAGDSISIPPSMHLSDAAHSTLQPPLSPPHKLNGDSPTKAMIPIEQKREGKLKVPSSDSVAIPPSKHLMVAASVDTQKIRYGGRAHHYRGQIGNATTLYPKDFIPSHHQNGQLILDVQDHLRPLSDLSISYNRQLPPSLFPTPAVYGSHRHGAPSNVYQIGYGSSQNHPAPPLVPLGWQSNLHRTHLPSTSHELHYRPFHDTRPHHPAPPMAPLGLQSDLHQVRLPSTTHELHHRPFLGAQPHVSQPPHFHSGAPSINSMPPGNRHIVQTGYLNGNSVQPVPPFQPGLHNARPSQ